MIDVVQANHGIVHVDGRHGEGLPLDNGHVHRWFRVFRVVVLKLLLLLMVTIQLVKGFPIFRSNRGDVLFCTFPRRGGVT